MNKITKKSFYSFLALYLISSFIFLALAAYWFFDAQVAMEKNANYYKMNHIADVVSSNIVHSAMNGIPYKLEMFDKAAISLFDKNKHFIDGMLVQELDFSQMFYMKDGVFTLISARTAGHSGIEYVVVQSSECIKNIDILKNTVAYTVIITAVLIILIAIFLSYIFLKPIRDKMEEIEEFVKDTTHELNTPITALMMSTSRIKNKKIYDEKIVQNISISTKQLYEIYSSLSFLSFDHQSEEAVTLSFNLVVHESVAYFSELLEKKNITIDVKLQECNISIAPTKAKMLINNLLSNAIKYSHPNTKITVITTPNSFTIIDEGIGIKEDKLHTIFKRFVRASSYAGGFGVGLNIVQSILKEYDFKITIDSIENKGTTIKLLFKE